MTHSSAHTLLTDFLILLTLCKRRRAVSFSSGMDATISFLKLCVSCEVSVLSALW